MSRALKDMRKASILSWYCGMSPLKFENEELSVSKVLIMFIIIYSFFLTSIAMLTDLAFSRKDYEGQLSYLILGPLQAISCLFIPFSSIYALSQTERLNSFLHNIEIVDACLKKYDATIKYSFNLNNAAISFVFIFILLFIQIYAGNFATVEFCLYSTFQHLAWWLIPVPTFQLTGFLMIISSRMQAILSVLRNAETLNTLYVLTKCHSLIARSANQLIDAVSLLFFSIILFIFLLFIGELYSLYFVVFALDYTLILTKILTMFYGLVLLIPLVYTCDLISKQAKEFYVLQYRLMIHDKSDQPWDKTFMSLYTCLKKDIKFCPYGVFYIDNKFLKSITVALLTNVIILIEVSQEIPNYPKKAYHIGG